MAGQLWLQSRLPLLVRFGTMDWNLSMIWFQALLLFCSDVVQAQVSSSNLPPSVTFILEPTPSSIPMAPVSPTSQIPDTIPTEESFFNSTSSIMSTPSNSSSSMKSIQSDTSQEMILLSTPAASPFYSPSMTLSSSSSSSSSSSLSSSSSSFSTMIPQTMIPSQQVLTSIPYTITQGMLSPSESLFYVSSQFNMQSSYWASTSMLVPSIAPTPSAVESSIPALVSTQMELQSTSSVTLLPTSSVTELPLSSSVAMATPQLSLHVTSMPITSTASTSSVFSSNPMQTPSIVPTRTSTSTTVPNLSSQILSMMSSASITSKPTPTSTPTSTTVPDLSSSSLRMMSSIAVTLKPTPTSGPSGSSSRPPTTEKSKGGPLTMVEWIIVAIAATVIVALLILCTGWWLLKVGRDNKRRPTYTIHNVTIDYSRSTNNDPKDVWRNSLLLESMSTRIVVPEENDDEIMQANFSATNPAYEGVSDEELPPSTSAGTLTRV